MLRVSGQSVHSWPDVQCSSARQLPWTRGLLAAHKDIGSSLALEDWGRHGVGRRRGAHRCLEQVGRWGRAAASATAGAGRGVLQFCVVMGFFPPLFNDQIIGSCLVAYFAQLCACVGGVRAGWRWLPRALLGAAARCSRCLPCSIILLLMVSFIKMLLCLMPFQRVVLGTSTQKKIVLSRSSGINSVIFYFEKDSSFKWLTVFDSGYASWLGEGRQGLILFSFS